MILDRIGTALILAAAGWLAMLITTDPGIWADPQYRQKVALIAAVVLVSSVFPRRLALTGTVLAFTALGLSAHVALFGLFGMELKGVVPIVLVAVGMWLRKERYDSDPIVLVSALVACGLSIVQPQIVFVTITFLVIVNLAMWLVNGIRTFRSSR